MSDELTSKAKREFCPQCGYGVVVPAGFKHDTRCPNAPLVDDDYAMWWVLPAKPINPDEG